ncbi:TPA: hypothetical protein ACPY9W_003515 [Klebsiella aerogenes]
MTDITELAQREKFENWARSQQLSLAYGDCGYFYSSTEMAWRAWMASSAELVEALEKAQRHIGELERKEEDLRPVGVMSEKAYHRLENRESRFIALWPRPEIYLPRKRPEDGVIVYARTAATTGIKWEAE